MTYDFDWVDAFSEKPFGGNGCVVVHGAETIPLEDRLKLVRETSLAECAYLVPSDIADFGARYYLAEREILMAGHPTIATVTSLLSRGLVERDCEFTLEVGAGVLPIKIRDGLITMTQARPEFLKEYDPATIAKIMGWMRATSLARRRLFQQGRRFALQFLRIRRL